MGSWDYGMRDDDGAQDVLDICSSALNRFIRKPGPVDVFLKRQVARTTEGDIGILALAEELFERGVDLRPALALIERSVQAELQPARLNLWDSPRVRRKALMDFLTRMKTKPRRSLLGSTRIEWDAQEDLGTARVHGKIGIVSRDRQWLIRPRFSFVGQFSEGRARVAVGTGRRKRFGMIDGHGRMVVRPIWETMGDMVEGRAAVSRRKKYGFIDREGKLVIPPAYDEVGEFSIGRAAVRVRKKWGFVTRSGRLIIPLQYDGVEAFSATSAHVNVDGEEFLIGLEGRRLSAKEAREAYFPILRQRSDSNKN